MKAAIVLVLLAAGCATDPAPAPPRSNGIAPQGLALQGHDAVNATFWDELAAHPLTQETFDTVPELATAIRQPAVVGTMTYVARGALPRDGELVLVVDGEELVFEGGLGLAPQWLVEPCDEACQEWMTGYFGASVNLYGVHVLVSYRPSEDGIIATDEFERATFPIQEGAFFGNMFETPARTYGCRGSDYDPYYMTMRACLLEGASCLIDVVGTCGALDPATGLASEPVCESEDPLNRAVRRCRAGGRTWDRVISLFLQDSHFGE